MSLAAAHAAKFDEDDFIVAAQVSNTIHIFDATTLAPKGGLFPGNFTAVRGLAFDAVGNVVSVSGQGELVVWDSDGQDVFSFTSSTLDDAAGVAVGPNGHYFVANQTYVNEYDSTGQLLRSLGNGDYKAVVLLTDQLMWAGGGGSGGAPGLLHVFNLDTGVMTSSIPLDHGQLQIQAMSYSPERNTVLLADSFAQAIYERDLTGQFLRRYDAAGLENPAGVIRGPSGRVFAADFRANPTNNSRIFIWDADGSFVEYQSFAGGIHGASNILWSGDRESDCNSNGLFDRWEIVAGSSGDCNRNAIPDECDIASGASSDCDFDGLPNDCTACSSASDCDDCDPATSDVCISGGCAHLVNCSDHHPADLDRDGDVDLVDFSIFEACFGGPSGSIPESCPLPFP